jgi:hypothetical protein
MENFRTIKEKKSVYSANVISYEDDIFLSEDEIYNKEKKCETR